MTSCILFFVVAVVNLAIGFALGCRSRIGEPTWPLLLDSFRLGSFRLDSLRRWRPRLPIGLLTRRATTSVEVEDDEDSPNEVAIEQPSPASTPDPVEAVDAVTVEGTIEELAAILKAGVESLASVQREIAAQGDSLTPDAVESASIDIDDKTQQMLQKTNSALDRLRQLAADSPEESDRCQSASELLEELWGRLNDSLVELIVLSFDTESLDATVGQLNSTIETITDGCNTTLEKLSGSLTTSSPVQATS